MARRCGVPTGLREPTGALCQAALDHNLLADVSQRVGDDACRCVAPENVAHVLARGAVARHVGEVPASATAWVSCCS